MKNVNNLTDYKKSLHHVEKLSKLQQAMKSALKDIEQYKSYIPAQECIEVISHNLIIVDVHLNHQKKIMDNKGLK